MNVQESVDIIGLNNAVELLDIVTTTRLVNVQESVDIIGLKNALELLEASNHH